MPPPLAFEDVALSYGDVTALSGVSVSFEPGFNVVLGPNGAGKTTLFRVGAGVLPPDSGGVRVAGEDPFARPATKRAVGYLPHGTPLNPRLTVAENLEYWGRVHGFGAAERAERVDSVLERLAIAPLRDRPATDLSRGQKQRVTIARCLLPDPTVLFLDEPTTGLDPTAAAGLRERLQALAAAGRTLCYSTHNLWEAELLADELTIIGAGTVLAKGAEATLSAAIRSGGVTHVRVECDATPADFAALDVEADQDDGVWVVSLGPDDAVPALVRGLVERDVAIEAVEPAQTSLEEIYRELVGAEADV